MCEKNFNCFYMYIDQINCFIKLSTSKIYIIIFCSNSSFILLTIKLEKMGCVFQNIHIKIV